MQPWTTPVGRALAQRQQPIFCVHYACESLHTTAQQTPCVTAVSIRLLGLDQTKSFSLGLMAEREGINSDEVPAAREMLESKLLEEFGCFLERMQQKYPEAWWFHWAMRDMTFGWPMLEHRTRTLLKKPICIEEDRLVDLHAALVEEFGRDFIARPQLLQLAELNGLAHADLLSGGREVEAYERGDYRSIARSTAKKAEIIGEVLIRYLDRTLLTLGSRQRQRRRKRWAVVSEEALPRELIGADEASRLCGLSRATWYRLLSGAKIPLPHKIGRRSLWDAKELRLWIDSQCPAQKVWREQRKLHGLGVKKGI